MTDIEKTREAFEAFLNPGNHAGNLSPWVEPGRYEKETHQLAWIAWKAATVRARQPATAPVVEVYRIPATGYLDPLTVFVENIAPGKGHITIRCFGRAWTAYWGAMGDRTIQEFFVCADDDYLAEDLAYGTTGAMLARHKKNETRYVTSIIKVVRDKFAEDMGI